jgi:hypothetical protein
MIPPIMAHYLRRIDRASAIELARDYLEYDDVTRADILAFFTSKGPEMIRELNESDD